MKSDIVAVLDAAARQGWKVVALDMILNTVMCQRGEEFVTWKFNVDGGNVDFFWGHYSNRAGAAHADFIERIS